MELSGRAHVSGVTVVVVDAQPNDVGCRLGVRELLIATRIIAPSRQPVEVHTTQAVAVVQHAQDAHRLRVAGGLPLL